MGYPIQLAHGWSDIAEQIDAERGRQKQLRAAGKFELTLAEPQPQQERLSKLVEEVGEVSRDLNDGQPWPMVREELVQVAACAVAWIQGGDAEYDLALRLKRQRGAE